MVPLVFAHLALIIYAIRGGLNAAEILSRTQGNILWFGFYATFVLASSLHAAIGLRSILFEWVGIKGIALKIATWAIALTLFLLGMRAVWAVTYGGSLT